uniref:Uncharacterized protein n=1 Tax=Cajanus cajan TaxID=3821 RepID=A0A151RBZ1_CAJCA|nr:hypothetical protein KK1_038623 [Cajanus cajan]
MEEASLKIFNSQVLVPFSLENGSIHAFLGPFAGQNKKKFCNTLLPEDTSTIPFIHSSEVDLALFGDTTKIFRDFPPIKDRHLQWLLRVEDAMSSSWYTRIYSTCQVRSTPALSTLLQNFSQIFQQPHSLPPSRPHDHHIPLIPSSNPVNIKPYRYPHSQKRHHDLPYFLYAS